MYSYTFFLIHDDCLDQGCSDYFAQKNQIIWELKIAQYKMYTKILAQGTKFGSGTTGLDNPGLDHEDCLGHGCQTVSRSLVELTHPPTF